MQSNHPAGKRDLIPDLPAAGQAANHLLTPTCSNYSRGRLPEAETDPQRVAGN